MYFSFKKLLDYPENRYALAKACMEYAKKVRYLHPEEYHNASDKDALVAIDHLLEGKVNYSMDRSEVEIDLSEDSILLTNQPDSETGNQETQENSEEDNED